MPTIAEVLQGATASRQRDEALQQAMQYLKLNQTLQQEQTQGQSDTDLAAAAISRAFQPDPPKPAAPPVLPPGPPPMGALGGMSVMPGAAPPMTPPNAMAPGQPSVPMQPPMGAPPPPQGMPMQPPAAPQGVPQLNRVNFQGNPQQVSQLLTQMTQDLQKSGQPTPWAQSPAAKLAAAGSVPGTPPQPDVIPPKLLSVPEFLSKLDQDPELKNNPRVKRLAMEKAFPLIQQQQQKEFKEAQLQLQSQDRVLRFEKEERLRLEQQLRDMRENERLSQGERRVQAIENRVAGGGAGAGAGAGAGGFNQEYDKLTPRQQATVDFYATQQIGGDSTWRVGLGRTAGGSALIKAVEERVPEVAEGLGLSAADVGTNRAKRVANQAALTQITKDITTIKPFASMLDQNADILKGLAKKIIKTQSPLANRPLNWLQNNAAGDPDVAEFLSQMKIVQTEAARVIQNPRLVGQLTDEAQREMQAIINGEMSLGATDRVLDRLINDSQRRVGQMEKQRDALTSGIKEQMTGPGKDAGGGNLEQEAKDAIAKGAPADKVRARYKQQTGKDLP